MKGKAFWLAFDGIVTALSIVVTIWSVKKSDEMAKVQAHLIAEELKKEGK